MTQLMSFLWKEAIMSILLEGGGTLNFSMLKNGLVQKVVSFIAPKIIGGEQSQSPVGGEGIEKMSEALTLERLNYQLVGEDIMIEGYISPEQGGTNICLQE